jgi:hypothetical protein
MDRHVPKGEPVSRIPYRHRDRLQQLRDPTDFRRATSAYGAREQRVRSMHHTQPQVSVAAARPRSGNRRQVIIRLMIGLTAAYLVGAALSVFVLRQQTADAPARKFYPPDLVNGVLAYDVTDPAPTSYGYLTADKVRIDDLGSVTEIDVSLSVDNRQDASINVPALDELRVVNADGAEATYLSGGWHGDPIVAARSSSSGDFRFAAPPAGGTLILEYREQADATPVRVAVGYARERRAATSGE